MLDEGFFRHLDTLVGALRFSTGEDQDEDGLAELEGLRDYLTQAVKLVDQAVTKVSSAKDKVTRLLSSRDKKELILQMAENNEIDHAFMIALDSNIKVITKSSPPFIPSAPPTFSIDLYHHIPSATSTFPSGSI